jgi:hypothetical protein
VPRTSNYEHCLFVCLDAQGYSARDAKRQKVLQRDISTAWQDAAIGAGLDQRAIRSQARGDGVLLVVPTGPAVPRGIDDFIRHLEALLARYNEDHQTESQLRLRVALDMGGLTKAKLGFAGSPPVTVTRLVESDELREALAKSGSHLAVMMSRSVYTEVKDGHTTLNAREFRQVTVSAKGATFEAWLWTPGHVQPATSNRSIAVARVIGTAAAVDSDQLTPASHPANPADSAFLPAGQPASQPISRNTGLRAFVIVALVLFAVTVAATALLASRTPTAGAGPLPTPSTNGPRPAIQPDSSATWSAPRPATPVVSRPTTPAGRVPSISPDTPNQPGTLVYGPNVVSNGHFTDVGVVPSTTLDTVGGAPSAAAGWDAFNNVATTTTTNHVASDGPDHGQMLQVCTGWDSGVFQLFGQGAGSAVVRVTVWLKVTSGEAGIGMGTGGEAGVNAGGYPSPSSDWQQITYVYDPAKEGGHPATEIIIIGLVQGQTCFDLDYVAVQTMT